MKSRPLPSQTQLISFFLIVNVSLSSVLCNLYPLNKHVKKSRVYRALGASPGIQYDTQINNLRGKPGEGYYLEVGIGTPQQKFNVLIDTGSSNLAVACNEDNNINRYFKTKQSSSYTNVGTKVNVPYTEGSWNGILGQDYVTISTMPNSTVMANIACINQADKFFINNSNWQGIMGLGYAEISRPDSSIEPFMDTFVRRKSVDNLFSVTLCGQGYKVPNPDGGVGGSIVFGSIAPTLYTGTLYPTPINKEWYYEVILVDVEVNGQSLGMDCKEYNFGKTIVDTGTTNLRLPSRVFNKVITLIKQGIKSSNLTITEERFWTSEEVLCWTSGQVPYGSFPTVSLVMPANETSVFKLIITPQQYLRAVEEEDSDVAGKDCYKLGISGLDSGTVLGAIVMEGFYVVFDRAHKQILFAESTCDFVDPAAVKPSIIGNIPYSGDYKDCAYKKPNVSNNTLTIVGYVLAGICGICLLPLIFLIVQWQCRQVRCRKGKLRRSNSDSNDLMDSS